MSLCQVHAQWDESNPFDDHLLLALLATLKIHDFQIGHPVWGPSSTVFYLCEHRLKTGPKLSAIDQELTSTIKRHGTSPNRVAWSCA